jgi:hypothetical protein
VSTVEPAGAVTLSPAPVEARTSRPAGLGAGGPDLPPSWPWPVIGTVVISPGWGFVGDAHTVVAHQLPHVGDPHVCGCHEAAPLSDIDVRRTRAAAGLLRRGTPPSVVYGWLRDQIRGTR